MAKALNVSLSVNADTSQAKAALQELQTSLSQLRSNSTNLNLGLNANDIQQASKAIVDLQSHLRAATNVNTGNLNFAKLDSSLKASKMTLADYGQSLMKLGPQGQQAFQQLTQAVALSEVPVKRLSSLFGEFGTVIKNTIRWQASSSLIHGFMGAIQSSFNYAQSLNKSLTNIQIVTQASDEHMARFAESANKAAKSLSTTTVRYTDASLIYYQQGLNDEEVARRATVTTKMANITGQSTQQVSEQLTAIWNNFAKGSTNLEYYADVITALGAATASSSEEISTGLEKFAAIADTVGLSYENATAALATITATTRQSADTVGTGLRTLFSRLQSLSLGETLEDGVNLTKYSKALNTVGVQVLDTSGNLRRMDDILFDLGEKWKDLSSAQQTALAQTVGGVRQYTTLVALMDNIDFYKENLNIAKNSAGTVQEQQEIYEKSWQASSDRVRASAESIYSSLINDKFFIGLNDTISGFLDLINSVIDGLGGLKGILLTIGTIATTVFKNNFAKGLLTARTGLKEFFTPTSVWQERKQSALDDLVNFAASPNTSDAIIKQQQNFLAHQTRSQVWYAQNKDQMSVFDQTRFQIMQDNINDSIQNYNQLIARQSDLRNNRGDFRSSLFGQAFDNIRNRQDYQDRARAEELVNKYGNVRNKNGDINLSQPGLANRGILSTQDRQDFEALIAKGVINRAGQISSSLSNWQTTDSGFMTKFAKDFDQGIGDMIMKSNWFNGKNENIIQGLLTSPAGKISGGNEQVNRMLKDQGVSQSLIDAYKQGQVKFSDLGAKQLQENISQISSDYGLKRADVEQYVNMLREELQVTQDIEKAREKVNAEIKKQLAEQEAVKQQARQEKQVTAVASAFLSLGMAISQVNGVMNQWSQVAKTGEGAGQALLSTLITVSMAFTGLFSALKAMKEAGLLAGLLGGLSAPQIAAVALGIIAVIAGISYGIKALDDAFESDKEKLERLKTESAEASSYAKQAQQAYDDLFSSQSSHNNLLDSLKELKEGTNEFYNSLIQANSQARELITNYKLSFGQDWKYNKQGAIEFTDTGNTKMSDQAKAKMAFGQYNNSLATFLQEDFSHTTLSNQDIISVVSQLFDNGANIGDYSEIIGLYEESYGWVRDTTLNQKETAEQMSKIMNYLINHPELLQSDNSDIALQQLSGIYGPQIQDLQRELLKSTGKGLIETLIPAIKEERTSNYLNIETMLRTYAETQDKDVSELQIQAALKDFKKQPGTANEDIVSFYEQTLKELETENNLSNLAERFFAATGFEADAELLENPDTMKTYIAKAETAKKYGAQFMDLVSDEVAQWSDYQTVSLKQLRKYREDAEKAGETSAGEILQKQIDEIVATPGKVMDLVQAQNKAIQNNKDLSEEEKAAQITKLAEAYGNALTNLTTIIENGTASAQEISQAMSTIQLSSQFGANFQSDVLKYIFTPEGVNEQLNNILSSIDFSKKTSSFLQLTEQAQILTGELQTAISAMAQDLYDDIGGTSGIFSEIFKEEEFQDGLKDLQKEFRKTGKLSAKNIDDVAESCEDLATALDLDVLSAGAVADAIELYSIGAVGSIDEISNAVWEVLEAVNAFEDGLAKAFKYIDEWDSHLDRSTQDLSDYFSKISKDIFELLGEGNVGGERLYQQLTGLFGEQYADSMRQFFIDQERGANKDNPQARQDAYDARYGQIDKWVQQAQKEGNNRALWEGLLSGDMDSEMSGSVQRERTTRRYNGSEMEEKTESYLDDSGTVSQNLKEIGFSLGENGDIELDTQGRTTEQMQAALALAMGIDMDSAGVWLQELAGHSASITQDLKTNDYTAALGKTLGMEEGSEDRTLSEMELARTDKTTLAESRARLEARQKELQSIADGQGRVTEESQAELDEIQSQLDLLDQVEQKKEDIAKDEETVAAAAGKTTGIYEQLTDTSKDFGNEVIKNNQKQVKSFDANGNAVEKEITDVQSLMDYYQSLGMTQEQAWEATKDAYQKYKEQNPNAELGEMGLAAEDAYGNLIGVALDAEASVEDVNAAQKQLAIDMKHSENQELGKDLFKGMVQAATEMSDELQNIEGIDATVDVTVNIKADEAKADIEKLSEGKDVDINVSDKGTVQSTQEAINGLKSSGVTAEVTADTSKAEATIAALETIHPHVIVDVSINPVATGAIITAAKNMARASYNSQASGGLIHSYDMGSANRTAAPGLSLTAEEGPEIVWNKNDGYAYLVGGNGHPEFVVLRPGDRVFNANETRKILNYERPDSNYFNSILQPQNLDQRLFGSFAEGSAYGSYGPNSTYGRSGGGNNQKTKEFTPERYHVITRQIQDLTFWYEELKKAREKAYGTNILDAIDKEIDATEELRKAQQALVDEAAQYKKADLKTLQDLLKGSGITLDLDANGNIRNFDQLQNKYKKAAEVDKDENAQKIWNALTQYEESLDKWQEAYSDLTDLALQKADLELEKISTEVELKVDFDERNLKLIEHYTKKIEDNIYESAKILSYAGQSLTKINDKINSTYKGISDIFANAKDSHGNDVDITLERFLTMSEAERDALDLNGDFGKQLEEYTDDLLEYTEQLEEFKTKGVEQLGKGIEKLNENVRDQLELFSHYGDILDSLKNIIDLQGTYISNDLRNMINTINQQMITNIGNNLSKELENYHRLENQVAILKNDIENTNDIDLKEAYKEQLKTLEDEFRTSEANLFQLWQDGLTQAQELFNNSLDNAIGNFEEKIAGGYKTLDNLQKAYETKQKNNDFYVEDYEKYYQISKLQRQINKDLENAAKNNISSNNRMRKLYDDLNNAREAGVQVSAYDLDIFAKRYEYEKALMDLEDARNAKNEVRLQRDANGRWGYVYTAAENDDDMIQKQQAVEDAFYQLQKAATDEAKRITDDILPGLASKVQEIKDYWSSGQDREAIEDQIQDLMNYWNKNKDQLKKAFNDANLTLEEAKDRYGADLFDILDNFDETTLGMFEKGSAGVDEYFSNLFNLINNANDEMGQAADVYDQNINYMNDFFKEYGKDFGEIIKTWASTMNTNSESTKNKAQQTIIDARNTFNEILTAAHDFEAKFMETYEPVIQRNEQFVISLTSALDQLNRTKYIDKLLNEAPVGSFQNPLNDYDPNDKKTIQKLLASIPQLNTDNQIYQIYNQKEIDEFLKSLSSFDSGGYTGEWGREGRLAMLHEKEQIFNPFDTKNLLNAAEILRTIDLSTDMFSKGLGNIITPLIHNISASTLDQNVHIEASFPNVTEHNEIELAFDNLINKASQYANRKNMSSMTFQDMYTSKF